jgi:arylsulfate sulfotransferase
MKKVYVNTILKTTMIIWPLIIYSCSEFNTKIASIKTSFLGDDILTAHVEVLTTDSLDVFIKYWKVGDEANPFVSPISANQKKHRFLLSHLQPGYDYVFTVNGSHGPLKGVGGEYFHFKTIEFKKGQKDTFHVVSPHPNAIPEIFKQGFVMLYRREDPGIIYLFDVDGNIVWHYQIKESGFKVVHFTESQTFLCLLGSKEYVTGYGNSILELSLTGDTLLYLVRGQNDFKQTIHHEILLNAKNQIVTLCQEEKILDLRSKGGSAKDTVKGDGILVMDREGREIWKWTVFEALNPLMDATILKNKKDWMHANSLAFDKDSNYLISFYNTGQIWKIDSHTRRVIWKLGRQGDFQMPALADFEEAHAVHMNQRGWLMLFDNGAKRQLSRSLAVQLDEPARKLKVTMNTWLPHQLSSDRMGSAYLVGDTSLLQCASKHGAILLTNFKGDLFWQLTANRLMPYRAEFIAKERIASLYKD